jgi:hypothetical protein
MQLNRFVFSSLVHANARRACEAARMLHAYALLACYIDARRACEATSICICKGYMHMLA